MKCVVLAGGLGLRLGKLVRENPKPMMKINGKTVIEDIVDNLHMHGINQIIVKLHYLPHKIISCIGDRALFYYEPQLLEHKATLLTLRPYLENEDFMVCNADTFTNLNYTDMIANYKRGTIMLFMDEYRSAGTWIYSKEWFENPDLPIVPYRPSGIYWFDLGTRAKLKEARELLKHEEFNPLP